MGAAKIGLEIEVPFAVYAAERIRLLELPITIADLDGAADALSQRKAALENYRSALITLGTAVLVISAGVVATTALATLLAVIPIILGLFVLAFLILRAGFRALDWSRYLCLHGAIPVEFAYADELASILERVDGSDGDHQIMRVASSGTMRTPMTSQPSDWTIGAGALEDRFIAISLFGKQAARNTLIAIVPPPTGSWKDYYLWHPPVRDRLGDLWSKSISKYQDWPVDHHKVRVALDVLANFASIVGSVPAKAGKLEKTLTKLLILALDREAKRLVESNQITPSEAIELRETGLKVERGGEAESLASESRKFRLSSGSDRWFHRLRNADYPAICSPLKMAIKAELGIDPSYIERKQPTNVEHSKPIQTRMC